LGVAIDDFGTGYSSLGYISRLPIDALKIDRSFVLRMTDDPQEMSIVTTIISLAHALDLKVIAEGVETPAQAQLLRLLKCDQIQGYLVARPQAAADAEGLLASSFDFAHRAG
jgi:EAL domain-containing protein (putative c-di-GMP-specific phosphodiesterase class I)